MKIRTDFVTNSSSSSFTLVAIQNKTFCEILNKYKDIPSQLIDPDDQSIEISINGDKAKISTANLGELIPYRKSEIIDCLVELIGIADLNEDDENFEICNAMYDEIDQNLKKIKEDMLFVKFISGSDDYGEFSDDCEDDDFDSDDIVKCDVYTYKDGKGKSSTLKVDYLYANDFLDNDWESEFK